MAMAMWDHATASGAMTPALRDEIVAVARRGLDGLQRAPHPDPNAIATAATWIAQHE